jgi:hypothetical protein
MTATLNAYIEANASLPPEITLGHIAWFEVSDGSYSAARLEAGFVKHGLNPAFLPGAINPADAYEKASKAVEGLKYDVQLPGGAVGTAVILVRDVARTQSQIQRQMIREIRDSNNKRLDYAKVGELVFYRPSTGVAGVVDHSTANVRSSLDPNLTPQEHALLTAHKAKFTADFDRFRNYHDGQKLRGVLRNYLLHLNAVLMKSSVYFVHKNRADELRALQAFCREIDGLGMTLWQLPDLPDHRLEVVEAFQREAEKALEGVVTNIQKVRATRKGSVSMAQFVKLKQEYDTIVAQAGEYSRTLEISQDRTAAASELALDALVALRTELIKAEEATA